MSDYQRIEKAINYLMERAHEQPSLEKIAAHVHLSPFHFQRLFCQWAGITPKRFLQVLTLERGKALLAESASLLDTSHAIGLSGSSRLHDHFVQLEAMTPGEYKNRGEGVIIEYGVHTTPFGELFMAKTQRGLCRAGFTDFVPVAEQLADLHKTWPQGTLVANPDATRAIIDSLFGQGSTKPGPLSLYVAGTNFQVAVWRALLRIPEGVLISYSQLAAHLGKPGASRAVGNAIGANPVAFIIPCHRVIQQSGALGGYRWGPTKKQMIQTWESMRLDAGSVDA